MAQGASESGGVTGASEISPLTRAGAVHVTVSDLNRSLGYYRDAIGLELLEREDGRASLGSGGRELVGLVEEPGARPARGHTGLYHFALLVPERAHLARWLAHAVKFPRFSGHPSARRESSRQASKEKRDAPEVHEAVPAGVPA